MRSVGLEHPGGEQVRVTLLASVILRQCVLQLQGRMAPLLYDKRTLPGTAFFDGRMPFLSPTTKPSVVSVGASGLLDSDKAAEVTSSAVTATKLLKLQFDDTALNCELSVPAVDCRTAATLA